MVIFCKPNFTFTYYHSKYYFMLWKTHITIVWSPRTEIVKWIELPEICHLDMLEPHSKALHKPYIITDTYVFIDIYNRSQESEPEADNNATQITLQAQSFILGNKFVL